MFLFLQAVKEEPIITDAKKTVISDAITNFNNAPAGTDVRLGQLHCHKNLDGTSKISVGNETRLSRNYNGTPQIYDEKTGQWRNLIEKDYSFLNRFFTPAMINEINRVISEAAKASSLIPTKNVAVIATTQSSKSEMEKLSESKSAEKIIEETTDFEVKAKAASLTYAAEEREKKRVEEQKELEDILLNRNERRIISMLPELIDNSFASREDRSLIRKAFEEGKLVLNEGKIIVMKGFKGSASQVRALQEKVGAASENLEKRAVMEVAADKDTEKKVTAIVTNVGFDLTKSQRAEMAKEMGSILGKMRIEEKVKDAIVQGLEAGSTLVMNYVNKIENDRTRDKVISELYRVALETGTEAKEKLGSDRFAAPRRTDFPKPA